MFGNQNTERTIAFKKPFNERYLIQQESEIVMSSLVIKTVTELRWDVRVLAVHEKYYHVELLSLDNVLVESNNPNMRDLSAFNNAFKKMYSELDMSISREGELIKLNNVPTIQRKWVQVKSEMEAIQNQHENIKHIIALNDEVFAKEANILAAVRANEFFEVFLNVFMGISLPDTIEKPKKSLFAQESIHWRFELSTEPYAFEKAVTVTISVKGAPRQNFDKNWLKSAYGSFPITEIADRKPLMSDKATYRIDLSSGRLLEGLLEKEEIVHPQLLKAKMTFSIKADHPEPEQKTNENKEAQKQQDKPVRAPGTSFIID